jgi:DNA-binding MarR family transcriptional regulator
MNSHQWIELEPEAAALEALSLRLSWSMRRRLAQQLDAFGLTMPQYMALTCIQRSAQGCSMTELAEASHQHTATMTGIVDRLVERGLVQRTRHPQDRRALIVALTDAGQQLMGEVAAHKRTWTRAFLSVLSAEERQSMLSAIERFLEVVEAGLSPENIVSGD